MLAALLIAALAGPAADVSLRREASVTGPSVTLGDVARVSGPAGEAAALSAVVLAPAPAGRGVVDLPTVRRRLEAAGLWSPGVTLSGAARCVVMRRDERPAAVRPVSAADLKAAEAKLRSAVLDRLAAAFPARSFECDVRLRPSDAAAVLSSDMRLSGGSADLTAPQTLTTAGEPPVVFEATLTERRAVQVAAFALPRGTVVNASHLTLAADEAGRGGLADSARLIGKQLRRPVPAGRPLTERDVQTVPLVRSGAVVSVSVATPGLRVTRLMKARGTGGRGDVIECVALDGPKTVAAVVTGVNTAEVGPPAAAGDIRDDRGAITFEAGADR